LEKENRVDSLPRRSELDEVISPELVLVDPELAQIARRRLPDRPEGRPPPRPAVSLSAPVRPALAHTFPPIEPRRDVRRSTRVFGAVAVAFPLLLIGGVVVGMIASEVRAQLVDDPVTLFLPSAPDAARSQPLATTAAPESEVRPDRRATPPRPVTRTRPSAPAKRPPASRPTPVKPAPVKPAPVKPTPVEPAKEPTPAPKASAKRPRVVPAPGTVDWVPTKSEVEARTLLLLQERVALRVPVALIDKKTGLFVNNVHVSCRRVGRTARFDCSLGVGRSPREWLLSVVVERDGSETLKWRGDVAAR